MDDLWWVALPDTEAAAALGGRWAAPDLDMVRHASGRPWLVGRWNDEAEAVTAGAGEVRVAVLGRSQLTPETLRAHVAKVSGAGDVRQVEHALDGTAGSYHLLASVGGRVWLRGSASAARRVFTARVDGVPTAASHTRLLAGLLDASWERETLAARLMDPALPWVARDSRTMWRQVRAVRPDEALVWERDGAQRTVRWWRPPAPELSLREASEALREALGAAVATCTSGGGTVSADLSGGLDSTSLCFLVAGRREADLVTLRWEGVDERNDDQVWARRAAEALPDATHLTVGQEHTPDWFAGLDTMSLATEEPAAWARDVAKQSDILRRAQAHGSRLHLTGVGGDELFTPAPSYLTDLLRSHPLSVSSRARRWRLDNRAGRRAVWRALYDRSGYPRWLRRAVRELTAPPPPLPESLLGWQPPPRMPAWATPEAVDAARTVLRRAADGCPEPLAPQRSLHAVLNQVREGGNAIRQMNQVLPGPGYATPYNDDAVVTAALSVRPQEASLAGRTKPLLTGAMRGIAPREVLCRTSKGCYDADFHRALRRRRGELLSLLDSSLLAQAGLIQPDRLRRLLHSHTSTGALGPLMPTLACELWLRSVNERQRLPIALFSREDP